MLSAQICYFYMYLCINVDLVGMEIDAVAAAGMSSGLTNVEWIRVYNDKCICAWNWH